MSTSIEKIHKFISAVNFCQTILVLISHNTSVETTLIAEFFQFIVAVAVKRFLGEKAYTLTSVLFALL